MKRCRIVHGGNGLGGTVSRIDTATGALPTISACSTFNMLSGDGTQPSDGVVEANDVLYGTASSGGANG